MTTDTISPLRQRMIEDMNARKLCAGTQRGHISSCKRFAAFLKRSPDTATLEDIRRFLMHVLPQGFHRIRYYGWLTSQTRVNNIARIRELLAAPLIPIDTIKAVNANPEEPKAPEHPCPCCGGRMRIIETFLRGQQPKHRRSPVSPKVRIDTS